MGKTYYRNDPPGCGAMVVIGLGILGFIFLWTAALSWLVMTLWNVIAVNFGATTIGFETAVAVVVLIGIVGSLLGRGRSS
jgi:hypothetical protein